jgi:PAS domain S-box-containing protein
VSPEVQKNAGETQVTEKPSFGAVVGDRHFLDELQEGVWVADGHGRIVFANRALARLSGFENPDVLTGKAWRELFPAPELARLARGKPESDAHTAGDSFILGRDNRNIPVTVSIARLKDGDAAWYVGTVLRSTHSRSGAGVTDSTSRVVMDNSVDGICLLEKGAISYVNHRFEELVGYSLSQVTRLGLERLISARDRRTVAQTIGEPGNVLMPVHHEVRLVNRSGHEIECELRIVPIQSDGNPVLLCFLRDVSALKQAERAQTDLIAMLSHDLRTPLAAIKEAMSLLSETAAPRLEDRQRRYLSIAREEIDRLNRMIDNLIEVSRMEAGKVELRLDGVDLAELLSSAIESLSLLVNKRNLTIERSIPPRMPLILGDRDRLLRVFNNLLDNAIKYSSVGGTIRVDIGFVDPSDPILTHSGVLDNTGYVNVTIADSGPGIPAEFLDRIFGKFERVDPHGPGIGLGLAIVRSIVEMHHGRVWAHSKLGEGAGFSFILPIKENQ